MRVGVVTFPGSLDDRDAAAAITATGGTPIPLWHGDRSVGDVDRIVLPGGFSYGDYLRCGAVAHRAPVMAAIRDFARDGGPVLGICNGFQILCEAGLLPGALLRNADLRFQCRHVPVRVETQTAWTAGYDAGQIVTLPIKHGAGRYHAAAATLDQLEADQRVVLRYVGDNPNGSQRAIGGVCNDARNVVGVMPHPEHAVDPALVGGSEGRGFFAVAAQPSVAS